MTNDEGSPKFEIRNSNMLQIVSGIFGIIHAVILRHGLFVIRRYPRAGHFVEMAAFVVISGGALVIFTVVPSRTF